MRRTLGANESTVTDAFGSVKISILHALHIVHRMVEAWTPLYERSGNAVLELCLRGSSSSRAP